MCETKIKIPLIIDFDNTLADSIKVFEEYYNEKYKNHPDFKPAKAENVTTWDFINEMPLLTHDEIEELFKSKYFFQKVKLKENAYEVIKRLHNSGKFEIIWCSIGTQENIINKCKYLEKQFPFIKNAEMIIQSGEIKMGKGEVIKKYVQNDILPIIVDDHVQNTNNEDCWNILFKEKDADWNKGFKGDFIVSNWLEVEKIVNKIYEIQYTNNICDKKYRPKLH